MLKRDTKIMLKYSRCSILLEVLCWLLLAALLIWSVQMYGTLSDTVATGFGPDGEPVEWNIRQVTLMQPITAVFVYIVLTGIDVIIRRAVSPDGEYPILRRVLLGLSGVKAVYLLYKLAKTCYVMAEAPVPRLLSVGFFLAAALAVLLTAAACLRCRRGSPGQA